MINISIAYIFSADEHCMNGNIADEQQQRDRLECLKDTRNLPYCVDCRKSKTWLTMAKEILKQNRINLYIFAEAGALLLCYLFNMVF